MARPNLSPERRAELLPRVAQAFAELGYRRATSALLAARCGLGENQLFRLWPDKKAMFLAALEHVFQRSAEVWERLLSEVEDPHEGFEHLLTYEALHHGEHGLYRIVFAGLSESDDDEIRAALRQLYARFQRFVQARLEARGQRSALDPALAAWAILGLGTVASIGRELGLLGAEKRRRLLLEAGRRLGGTTAD